MFYPKLRHAPSNSIIDISSHNQNQSPSRKSSYFSHHQLCHSYSDDSLDKQFLVNTKQTVDKLFQQTNFNGILDQIQFTLQPIVEQLRQQIQRKKYLSKQDRFVCMKSCAKFITETLIHEQWDRNNDFTELYQLQKILNHFLSKQQTDEQLEIDMNKLQIDKPSKTTNLEGSSTHKPRRVSFVSTDEHPTDDLTRQKNYHKSVSRAFKKLNADLQKLNHETPFKAHLSKYHKHNH
jgi:hypothetical protein